MSDALSRAYPAASTEESASQNFSADVAQLSSYKLKPPPPTPQPQPQPQPPAPSLSPLSVVASDYVVKLIRDAAETDQMYIRLRAYIKSGWPAAKHSLPEELRIFHSCRDELAVEQNLIFKGPRLFVPTAARAAMIERAHSSHIGLNSALRRVRECIFWPRMTRQITDYISQCPICNQLPAAAPPKEPLISHPTPTRAWEKVAIDLFQIGDKDYMVTVDYATNFFEVDRLETKRSSEVIRKLRPHFSRHGIPLYAVTDGGPCFASHEFRSFVGKWEVEHIMSSPTYSRSNGKAENAVKTVKRILKRATADGRDPYLALLDWRNAPC